MAQDKPDPQLQTYLDAIATYEREFKKWEGRVEKILKRYRDDARTDKDSESKFNVLWSNVQTLMPACFSRLPQPDVSRRFRDNDPVGRVASLMLERALDFEVQHYIDYRITMKQSVLDRFLGGRGTCWVRYEPKFKPAEQVTEDVDTEEPQEQLDYECAPVDYVHWRDFGHSVARTWEEVTLVWRKVYMNEAAVIERFGEELAKKIPYDATPEETKANTRAEGTVRKQALVIELWDKEKRQAVWISKGLKQELDAVSDPLGLQDFFPCARPLYATLTNESLIPVPDFTLYQDQAKDLDVLADRISGLVHMLQLKGVCDASSPVLERLFTEGTNGKLLPVKNWAAFAEKQGLKGSIDIVDLTMLANALQTAIEAFQQKKAEVDEISGVIDVMRGKVDPKEKLGQTQMRGSGASLRLKDMQQAVALYATEILQLKAQVFCRKFQPQTLLAMAAADQLTQEDQQYVQPALALLMGEERLSDPEANAPNPLRSFRIEVAADTLVQLDEQVEKQDRMEMLTAFAGYLKNAGEVGAQAPQLIPLIIEVAKFGLQAFKIGKAIEGTFDTALDQLKNAGPPPDPEAMKQQIEAQVRQQLTMENADKEIKLNSRAADLDIREMKFQAEQQLAKQEQEMARRQDEMAGQMRDQEMGMKVKDMVCKHEEGVRSMVDGIKSESMKASQDEATAQVAEQKMAQRGEKIEQLMQAVAQSSVELQSQVAQLVQAMQAPRRRDIVRGEDGRAVSMVERPA